MAITHSIGSNVRRAFRSAEFNVASAARALETGAPRVALVGVQSSAASKAALELSEVFSELDGDSNHGRGSELALMARWAMKGARDYGKQAQIWTVGIADPAGTAAVEKITAAVGTITAAGDVVIKIAGRRIPVGCAVGDDQDDVASKIADAIQERASELPVTAAVNGVNANEVDVTAVCTGVNGNDVVYSVDDSAIAGVSVSSAQSVAGVGAVDVSAALDVLIDKDYDFIAFSNHTSTDISDMAAHNTSMWDPITKKWRFGVIAETGSLATGQALATAADDMGQIVITAEDWPNTPGEIAAYCAAIWAGETDPAKPFTELDLPSLYLPDAASVPTAAEIESAIAGGMTILTTNAQRTRARFNRCVNTKVTENSVPFYAASDITTPKTLVYLARAVDTAQGLILAQAKKSARTLRRIRSATLAVLFAAEVAEWIQNVEDHKGELVVETDPDLATRIATAIPASVVPPLIGTANVFNLLQE